MLTRTGWCLACLSTFCFCSPLLRYIHSVTRAQANPHAHRSVNGLHSNGASVGGSRSVMTSSSPDWHALSHLLLTHSLLANHLYQLYWGLTHQEYERFGGGGIAGISHWLGLDNSSGMDDDISDSRVTTPAWAPSSSVTAHQTDMIARVSASFHRLASRILSAAPDEIPSLTKAAVAKAAADQLLRIDHSHTHLLVNNWLHIHFSLTPNPDRMLPLPIPTADGSQHIQPYHSCLFTVRPQVLLSELPHDASPILRRFIIHSSPLISFNALSSELGVSLDYLYRIVAHLVYWNKCRIIDVVAMNNLYVIDHTHALIGTMAHNATILAGGHSASSASGRGRVSWATSTSKRSSSARPSLTASNQAGSSRRRNASVDPSASSSLPLAPPFIPASLLYEWTQQWPAASLTALLTHLSQRRTLGEHMQRLTAIAALTAHLYTPLPSIVGTTGTAIPPHPPIPTAPVTSTVPPLSSSSSTSSSSAAATSTSTSTPLPSLSFSPLSPKFIRSVEDRLQHEFIQQLLFLMRKRWIQQMHTFIARIHEHDDDDASDEETESEDDDEEEDEAEDDSVDQRHEDESAMAAVVSSNSPIVGRSSGETSRQHNQPHGHHPSHAATATSTSAPASALDPWHALLERLSFLYFDGRHSTTEILWKERSTGLTEQHLHHLIKLFPTKLFTITRT